MEDYYITYSKAQEGLIRQTEYDTRQHGKMNCGVKSNPNIQVKGLVKYSKGIQDERAEGV